MDAASSMEPEALAAIFRSAGAIYEDCDETKRQRLLAWHPRVRSIPAALRPEDGRQRYCVYDGPCYAAFPNLSVRANGEKRQPREHLRDCEEEIARLIYEERFGRPKGRKRARDGS